MNKNNDCQESQKRSDNYVTLSLRGGGCGTSNIENKIHAQEQFIDKTNLPNYFISDIAKHLNTICDKAQVAYDEKQKEEILISIQWFISMREHLNRLCNDTKSAAAVYDLIFGSLPKLLKSAVTFLRISGFLCLQILQISNDLTRVLFTFFMNNNKRFLKIEDKESLEELIIEFETQLNIEAQNIWMAGAEFEINMIKAVVQSSPSNSDEGQKLLISFMGGLVKSVLTMSPSEDFIDALIGGAKFLHKAYQSNNLKKKYEVYYYFESMKWYVIQLLKDDVPVIKLIQLLREGYRRYIENSNDWLLNFCWVKMIASLISYRPLICKQELCLNQQQQQHMWNKLIQLKCVNSLSFNKNIGRLSLFQDLQNQKTSQLSQLLRQVGLKSFEKFSETILENISSQSDELFSLQTITQTERQQRNYLDLIYQQDTDLDQQIDSQSSLFIEFEQIIAQVQKDSETLQLLSNSQKEGKIQEIVQNIQQMIKLGFSSFLQTIAIRNTIQMHIQKNKIIIESIIVDQSEGIEKLKKQILNLEKKFEGNELLIQLLDQQSKIIESIVNLEVGFQILQTAKVSNGQIDSNIKQKVQSIPKILNQYQAVSKQYSSLIGELKEINRNKSPFQKSQIIKYQTANPLQTLIETIKKIISQNIIESKIQMIFKSYQQGSTLPGDAYIKLGFFNTLKYQMLDLIGQMINFKEVLYQMLSFLEKNANSLFQMTTQSDSEINQDSVNEMLAKQLKMIISFFLQEEKCIIDNKYTNSISLEQISALLKKNSQQLQAQQAMQDNVLSIRQATAFVDQFLWQYQKSPQKLSFIKDQIISIYKKLNIKSEDMQIGQQQFNQVEQNVLLMSRQIENLKFHLGQLIENISTAIDNSKCIHNGVLDEILLHENIQNIRLQLNLQDQCDSQYFQDYEANLNLQFKDPFKQLSEFKLDFIEKNFETINQGLTENLDIIIIFIDQMQNRLPFIEYKDGNIIAETMENFQTVVQDAKDIMDNQNYKVRQCVVISLIQIQASTQEQHLVKFCQDNLVYIWGSEKDERVKSLLKNTEVLDMQKHLFSSDLKSFSQRLQIEMEKRFEKINDLEQRIHQEGDSQIRLQLQQDLEVEQREFEDYLDNINEMSQKLDIGIQFLKDIKRSLAQLKQKIDKLQDTVNIIGDDVRKLRGKSYAELFNIRKRKVLDSMQLRSINQIYIPLKCQEWDPVSGKQVGNPSILLHDSFTNQDGEINEFLQNDSKEKDILLLRGIAGSGKSRAAGKIEEFLWQKNDLKESVWFPIYVSLPTIKEPKFNLLDQALESEFYQFDKIQIREFKEALQQENLKIILILDSYDEMKQECIQSNLYHTNRMAQDLFGHLSDIKNVKNFLKVIITTRTEILTSSSYQTWFYGEKLEGLKEVELLGFDQEQKQKYLQEYTMLSMKKEFLELNTKNQTNQLNEFVHFWKKIIEFLIKNPSPRDDYLLSEKQANQICTIVKQEKCYHKLSKDQLVNLEKKLIDLWNVNKFEKLIESAQIQHILTTPFMMEIVVQVLPSMTKKYSDASGFKEIFLTNFIKIKQEEHEERSLIAKYKNNKNKNFPQKDIQSNFDKKELLLQANKIWDQLQNEKYFTKFSLVDKISVNDLSTIDQANLVVKALIVKKLTVFDFYFTFVDFYHRQQIRKQQELGRPCNQESLLIDLFFFSQSLALDMMLRQLTQIKYHSKGQLNLKFVKLNDQQDWQDTYFNDFEANGEYKKLIRSCILLTQKGSNHSFTHKSIQEFYVGHFLLKSLEELQNFEENHFQEIIDIYKWEENLLKLKQSIQQKEQQFQQFGDIQQFCINVSNSLYNSNQFNISTDSYKGVISLIKEEIKKQNQLKPKLIQVVKLSSISNQFIRASSNSIYLLGQMNEYLGYSNLQNIQLSDTELLGLSFYGSNLEGSVLNNINVNSCNFNKVNIKNSRWTDIKCNELHSVIGDKNQLNKIVFSQSGQLLVSCSSDVVYMCNIQQGTQNVLIDYKNVMSEQHFGEQYKYTNGINQMMFSPDESVLAVGWYQALGYDYLAYEFSVIQICDVKSGQMTYLQGQSYKIQQLIFAPDSQQLAACGQKPFILLWNIKDSKQIACFEGHESQVNFIAFTQDGKILGSCSQDLTIRLWKLSDSSQHQILKGHTKNVNQIAFQPDGLTLASCSEDMTVRLWSIVTYQNICILQAHTQNVTKLAFLPDGQTLVSSGQDKLILVWDVKEQKQLRCIEGSQGDYSYYACSSNGKLLAQQNQSEIQIWDITVGKIVTVFEGQTQRIIDMAFQPGVQILASINQYDNQIKLWDAQTEKNKNQFDGHASQVLLIAFSPDSTKLASWGRDTTLRLWNVSNGKQILILDKIQTGVEKIRFSEDGQYLFIQTFQNLSNYLWYFKDDNLITIDFPKLNTKEITSPIISQPHGEMLAWGLLVNNQTPIIIWNVKDQTSKQLLGHQKRITQLVYSSNGQQLISHSDDKAVKIWDMKEYKKLQYFDQVSTIVYSNNKEVFGFYNSTKKRMKIYSVKETKELGEIELLTGYNLFLSENIFAQAIGQKINLWDFKEGKQIAVLEGHSQNISGAEFSPDGEVLVSYSKEATIRVWSMESNKEKAQLKGHTSQISGVRFSPNGEILASYGKDQTIILWETKEFGQRSILKGHQNDLLFLIFSADNSVLASADSSCKIILWNVMDSSQIKEFEHCATGGYSFDQRSIAFSYDSNYFVCYSTILLRNIIWDLKQNSQHGLLAGHKGVRNVIFTSDSSTLATVSEGESFLLLWNLKECSMEELINSKGTYLIQTVISQDQKILAVFGNDIVIQIWDAKSGKHVTTLSGHRHIVSSICFSPDGQYLVSAGWDQTIRLWDISEWKLISILQGHQHQIDYIGFSPDGLTLASASKDNTIRLWNLSNSKEIKLIENSQQILNVKQLIFSPDGLRIAWFSDQQKSVYLLNLKEEVEALTLNLEYKATNIVGFTQNNQIIITDELITSIFDLVKTESIASFQEKISVLSQNGYMFVILGSSGNRKQFFFWDLQRIQEIQTQEEHTNDIVSIDFSPDDRVLASCGSDGMIKLWDVTQKIPVCYKTLAIYQSLTASECQISGAEITSKIGWDLKQLFIQKGAIE